MTCSAPERTRSSPLRPSSSANSRNTSSPKPWKVLIAASLSPIGVLRSTRSCICAAAFSVKVTARISCGLAAAVAMRWTIRAVSTWVLPVPAPATTRSGPAPCSTARRCSPVSEARMSGRGSPPSQNSSWSLMRSAGARWKLPDQTAHAFDITSGRTRRRGPRACAPTDPGGREGRRRGLDPTSRRRRCRGGPTPCPPR